MPQGYRNKDDSKLGFQKGHKFNIGHIPWNKGKKEVYSKETITKMSKKRPHIEGSNNPNWKGGKIIINGYIYLYYLNHPFQYPQGYIAEHRLVMEKHIGRYLKPTEVIHHRNGNTLDNRIENLKLFKSQSEHSKFEKRYKFAIFHNKQ